MATRYGCLASDAGSAYPAYLRCILFFNSMSSFPLFSVVTVTLNCSQDALATARSVGSQSFRDYQYIIKDGESSDGTIEELRGEGLAVRVTKDSGVYDAMNQALRLCHGLYICFLNAGDIFVDKHVLRRVAEFIRCAREADIYYGDMIMNIPDPHTDPGEDRRLIRHTPYPERPSRFFLYRQGLCHQGWFVRKAVYGEEPFDVRLKIMADYDFLLTQILRKRVRLEHMPVTIANYKGSGLSEQLRDEWAEERKHLVRKYFPLAERALYDGIRQSAHLVLTTIRRARSAGLTNC